MKTLILKILPLLFMIILPGALKSQTITTTAAPVTSCPGEIQVPVNVTDCNGIGAISLVLNFDTSRLTYVGYQDLHSALTVGLLIIYSTGNKVSIGWTNMTAANLGNSTMVKLRFNTIPGTSPLAWDTQTSGNCEYGNINGVILPATFINGTATINQPPVITGQPVNRTVLVGQSTTFSVAANGTGIAYLWQISINGGGSWTDLTNNATYSNVTYPTLYLSNALLTYNGYMYRCRLTGTCTPVIYTNEVTLTVINPVTTTLPTASFCPGNIIVPVAVTNFAGVAAFSLTFTYNPAYLNYTGYQSLNGALSGGTFVTNITGGLVYMTWYSTTAVTFGNGTLIELLFTASTGTSVLAWDLANEGNCEYTALNGTQITSVFVNGNETIYGIPAVTIHPVNRLIAKGQNTTFSVTATGNGLSYLWQFSTNGGSIWNDLSNNSTYSNVTTSTMGITNAQLSMSGYQYRCKVSGTCTPIVYSNPGLLTVLPNIITTCGTITGCPGQVVIPLIVTDFIGVGAFSLALNYDTSVLSYSGYQNLNAALNGGSFVINASGGTLYLTWSKTVATTIPNGAVLIELLFNGVTGSSAMTWDTQTPGNCEYSDLTGQVIFATWNNGGVTVYQVPSIGTQPVNRTIYAGGSTSFSVGASGTGLGYLWQLSTNNGLNWSNLTNVSPYSGVYTSTLNINPAATGMNGYQYHCIVSGTCVPSVTSNATLLTVTQAAITTTPGGAVNSCTGNLSIPLNVTNCTNVGSISLTMVFDTTKLTFDGYHSVNSALNGGLLVVNRSGNKVYLSWASTTAANIGAGVLIQYRFKANAGISTTINWDTQTTGACEYSDPAGLIIASFYNTSTITVNANALIVNAGNDVIMQSSSVQLNGSATGGTPPYTWSWTPVTWLNNPAIPNPVASPPATTTYTLTVNSTGCSGSDQVNVIISVPANLSLQNITVGNGETNCYNASQIITVAGSGTSFVIQNGGHVTMIAGLKIDFLPGTRVYPGGYLHGYITTTDQYCNTLSAPGFVASVEEPIIPPVDGSMFSIYPNPTTGQFTLRLADEIAKGKMYLAIYGACGEMIIREEIPGEKYQEFSLDGRPGGIYFVRIVAGDRCITKKLIKQ